MPPPPSSLSLLLCAALKVSLQGHHIQRWYSAGIFARRPGAACLGPPELGPTSQGPSVLVTSLYLDQQHQGPTAISPHMPLMVPPYARVRFPTPYWPSSAATLALAYMHVLCAPDSTSVGQAHAAEPHQAPLHAHFASFTPLRARAWHRGRLGLNRRAPFLPVRVACARSYMVLCGHDGERDHVLRLLRMARDMLALTELPLHNGEYVTVRVGLNTGPAQSGVLGTRRIKWTCWGDRWVQRARHLAGGRQGTCGGAGGRGRVLCASSGRAGATGGCSEHDTWQGAGRGCVEGQGEEAECCSRQVDVLGRQVGSASTTPGKGQAGDVWRGRGKRQSAVRVKWTCWGNRGEERAETPLRLCCGDPKICRVPKM